MINYKKLKKILDDPSVTKVRTEKQKMAILKSLRKQNNNRRKIIKGGN